MMLGNREFSSVAQPGECASARERALPPRGFSFDRYTRCATFRPRYDHAGYGCIRIPRDKVNRKIRRAWRARPGKSAGRSERRALPRVFSVRGVFRARIVFDFRPIKVDSAHSVRYSAPRNTPGGPPLSAGRIRAFGSRLQERNIPFPISPGALPQPPASPSRLGEILFKCFLAYK